jgi:hypothetical protein
MSARKKLKSIRWPLHVINSGKMTCTGCYEQPFSVTFGLDASAAVKLGQKMNRKIVSIIAVMSEL